MKNTYSIKAEKHLEEFTRWNTIRKTYKEFLMSWCIHMLDIHLKPPIVAQFSMLLLFHQCSTPIWNILSHLHLVFSINTTKQLYDVATSVLISIQSEWLQHTIIVIVGVNNMSYITYNTQI